MSKDDFLCSQHNKHSNNNCNHEDPSQSSYIYINLSCHYFQKKIPVSENVNCHACQDSC
jgi:hypothetical protein